MYLPESEWLQDQALIFDGSGNNLTDGLQYCPAAYARCPGAVTAERVWRWWDNGQLLALYPDGLPAVVVAAVDLADRVATEYRHERQRVLGEDAKNNANKTTHT